MSKSTGTSQLMLSLITCLYPFEIFAGFYRDRFEGR